MATDVLKERASPDCLLAKNHFVILAFFALTQIWWHILSRLCFGGISHPVLYVDLVNKQRRVKGASNFLTSGPTIVKRLRRRKYDPMFIEITIGLVLGPFSTLYRSFLENYTLTNKAVGNIWRDLSKPPHMRSSSSPLWLFVGTPSALWSCSLTIWAKHSQLLGMSWYVFDILFYHLTFLYNDCSEFLSYDLVRSLPFFAK